MRNSRTQRTEPNRSQPLGFLVGGALRRAEDDFHRASELGGQVGQHRFATAAQLHLAQHAAQPDHHLAAVEPARGEDVTERGTT